VLPPAPPPRRITRRAALVGLTALGTAACTPYENASQRRRDGRPSDPASEPTKAPDIDPDVVLAARVLIDEEAVLDRVEATISAFPRLRGSLGVALETHAAHVELLRDAVPDPDDPDLPDEGSFSAGGGVPRERRRALLSLARLEEELGLVGKQSAFAAQSGAFARVLASMAAAAAQQSVLLRRAAGAGGPS
jgi:hypothetical protein